MKIIGIDPGLTTGWCVILALPGGRIDPIVWGQLPLDFHFSDALSSEIIRWSPEVAAVERVAHSGQLTKGKLAQIQAHDRTKMTLSGMSKIKQIVDLVPESRKKIDVPREIKGDHARDAYRLAVACYYSLQQGLPNTIDILPPLK